MKNLNKTIFSMTKKIVIWLFLVFNLGTARSPKDFYPLLRKLDELRESRGINFVVSLLKDTRVVLMNYLGGNVIKIKGVRTTKDGIPTILGDLIPIIRNSPHPDILRVVTTVLSCTRALSLGKGLDLESIISPAKQEPCDISEFMSDFWRELGYRYQGRVPRSLMWRNCHLSTKVGPNSKNDNALWTSLSDLYSLPRDLEDDIRLIGGKKMCDRIDTLFYGGVFFRKLIRLIIPFERFGKIRKLSAIKDKELKVRTIAIGDYWSQTALIPLHKYLFNVLKKIPQDCTFGQDKGPLKIGTQGYYCSADLTAATDRFPISTISQVLAGILPDEYVSAWQRIMVAHPFDVKIGKEVKQVRYAVGNPMGFYSSWASFAVAHHYVVYYCCRKLGKDWKTLPYILLGDDVVIGDQAVASLYKEVMQGLGVELSKPKTYESTHLFEFAKRIFYKGVEISPFPISGLKEVERKYYLLTQFFIEAEGKGWVSHCGVPVMVATYLEHVCRLPSKFRNKLARASRVYESVQRIVRGAENAGELLQTAFGELGYQFKLSNFVALNVLENIAVDLYATNNPMSSWKENIESGKFTLFQVEFALLGKSLDVAPNMLPRYHEYIKSLPVCDVVSVLNDAAMDVAKENLARSQTTGKWPLLLKASAYPVSKDVLIHRSSFLISRTVSKIAKLLKDRAEILGFYPPEELLRETPG